MVFLVGVGFIRPGLFVNFSIGFDKSNPYKLLVTVFINNILYILFLLLVPGFLTLPFSSFFTIYDIRYTNQTPEKALNPPSMGTMIPVTNFEASEASQTHAPIKSSGSPNLSIGV